MTSHTLRVGNGAGFWGDNLDAPFSRARRPARRPDARIPGRADAGDPQPSAGEGPGRRLRHRLPRAARAARCRSCASRRTLKIVTNAGGLNPVGLRPALRERSSERRGRGSASLGVVTGDDILARIPEWIARRGRPRPHGDGRADRDGGRSAGQSPTPTSVPGRSPRRSAAGARIVITGRVADASLTLGPACCPLRLGLGRLAAPGRGVGRRPPHRVRRPGDGRALASLGRARRPRRRRLPDRRDRRRRLVRDHQARGDGRPGHRRRPSPSSSSTRSTTPRATGRPTWTSTSRRSRSTQEGPDRVAVRGATGRAAVRPAQGGRGLSRRLDGQRDARGGRARRRGQGPRGGRDRSSTASRRGGVRAGRLAGRMPRARATSCRGVLRPAAPPFEVVLRVTVRDPNRAAVERFCREFAPLVTSGPPGIAGYATGRPTPRPAFGYWPALVPRELVEQPRRGPPGGRVGTWPRRPRRRRSIA